MTTLKSKFPRKLTYKEFSDMGNVADFNSHHGTDLRWGAVIPDYRASDEELYRQYENWYAKTYTKLGQIL